MVTSARASFAPAHRERRGKVADGLAVHASASTAAVVDSPGADAIPGSRAAQLARELRLGARRGALCVFSKFNVAHPDVEMIPRDVGV